MQEAPFSRVREKARLDETAGTFAQLKPVRSERRNDPAVGRARRAHEAPAAAPGRRSGFDRRCRPSSRGGGPGRASRRRAARDWPSRRHGCVASAPRGAGCRTERGRCCPRFRSGRSAPYASSPPGSRARARGSRVRRAMASATPASPGAPPPSLIFITVEPGADRLDLPPTAGGVPWPGSRQMSAAAARPAAPRITRAAPPGRRSPAGSGTRSPSASRRRARRSSRSRRSRRAPA